MQKTRPPGALVAGALILGLALPGASPHPASAQGGTMALVGGMLLDGYETPPIHHAAVVIEGNRIVAVGPATEVEIPAGAEIISTEGMTMLPGLVDLHVHLMILGHGEYSEWWPILDKAREEMMAISAKQLLMAGVTTAVDLGAPLEILNVRDDINEGWLPGPRMLVSGPWITRAGRQWPDWFQRRIASPEEAAEQTNDLIDAGVDVIKIWAGMTEDDMRAVVEAAHRRGVEVHTHLYAPEDMWAAIRAGTDVIQHAGSGGNPPYGDDLIAEVAHRGIPVVQTIAHRIWVYPATLEFPERLQDHRLKQDLPPELYGEFQRSFEDFHRNSYFRTTPRQIRNSEIAARQFIEGGAVIAMGTDSGSPMNFHTEAAWREISALVDSGMTPLAAISASTKTGAEVIGRGRDLGTIEPGKLADIIVVEGNPLFDINVLGYVRMVVKDGVRYK
ncbi:MAG: amidohydrolase family protein [Gammaproteobacteria bacterium]|nr:amidohydrolase family protein [Gammaproteobacteria bacterium]